MDDADSPDIINPASVPMFPDVADHAPVPLFSTDAGGRYIFVNKRWSDLTGISAVDALGWGWERALHPDDVAGVVERWRRCVMAGDELHLRMRLVRPDGRIARVHLHAVPAPGRRGRTGFVGTLALLPAAVAAAAVPPPASPGERRAQLGAGDIAVDAVAHPAHDTAGGLEADHTHDESCDCLFTQLRRVERQVREGDERLTLLISALRSPVLIADADRRVIAVNEAFCDTFEVSAEPSDLIGTDCASLARPVPGLVDDAAGFAARLVTLLRRREAVVREEVMLADGRVFERSHVPVTEGGVYRGHLWVYSDVTERRILEAETEGLIAAGLEPPEDHLAGPLSRTRPDLRPLATGWRSDGSPIPGPTGAGAGGPAGGAGSDAPLAAARGARDLALDLRAPLASVISYVGLLRDGVAGRLTAEQQSLMRVVAAAAQVLVELVAERVGPIDPESPYPADSDGPDVF